MKKGKLFGVGVGPGDPQLLTLKAISTIEACPIVAAPRTRGGMAALDIVRGVMNLDGKTVIPLDFAMSHDRGEREASHRVAADLVRVELEGGRDVAMLNLGDVSVYASFHYIWDILKPEGFEMAMIPGITSFCAAAAELGVSLTDMESPIRIIPNGTGRGGDADGETSIWMKSGRHLEKLLEQLRLEGRLDRAMLVQNCGMPNQRVYPSLQGVDAANDYFSVVIVRDGEETA